MKLKNYELIGLNNALGELASEKLVGSFKFKLFKNKLKLEDAILPVSKSLQDESNEGAEEILDLEQEIDLELILESDLEQVPTTLKQLNALKPILKEGE